MLSIVLQVATIIISIILVGLIMLQVRGGGLGSLLGGDLSGGISHTRRGLEKTLFQITVGLAIGFVAIAILAFSFVS